MRHTGSTARRSFLLRGSALAAAALSPGGAQGEPLADPPWSAGPGHPILSPAYGLPSPFEKDVVRRGVGTTPTTLSSWSFTPLQDLHGIITPNGLVFERHHAGVPAIDPDAHRLLLHGMVERPLVFSMDEIVRFPSVSRIHFLECSGNGSAEWKAPKAASIQQSHGLLSCCEWTGVPLATVLAEAGVKPGAKWMLAEGADAALMTRSIPIEKALDDALLVYAQNGERLRPEQGYPLRLFLPGFEGNMSIKWLRRLKVGDAPFQTREETSKYTDLLPDGTARRFTFHMEAKSVVTSPSAGQVLRSRGFREISGLAWSGRGTIRRVDVSVDAGRTWREAVLQQPVLPRALTRFRLPWRWEGGPAIVQSRAIDDTGYVQPTRDQLIAARGLNSYYHNNSIQSWAVGENGEVRNVHA
ncbi:MAG TPA: sulfite dehydrogenase [Burkholderiales bacterium]|nr:sulfite dehydrogenase [Burkholderiales bacterium]